MESNASDTTNENPFGQVAWVTRLTVLRQSLIELSPDRATATAVTSLLHDTPTLEHDGTLALAFDMIITALRADPPCSIEAVQALVPSAVEHDAVLALRRHFLAIQMLLDKAKENVAATLDIIVSRFQLGAVSTKDACMPVPVLLTWMRDASMSPELKGKFDSELSDLRRSLPADVQHANPVRDLVVPALYCFVTGRTKYLPAIVNRTIQYDRPSRQMRVAIRSDRAGGSWYRWLPCELHVDRTATATILSCINNLDPETYAGLYQSIEQLFSQCVPLFENVLSCLDSDADDRLLTTLYEHCHYSLPLAEWERCQVVVRLREIQLTPEHPTIGEKNWNEEGTETDQIIATGVVFYSVTNLTQPRLAIRKDVDFALHMPDDNLTLGLTYGLANQDQLEQELGHITAMEGRCVVLPNLYRYILEPFGLDDRTRPGTLGMLTFLLDAPSPVEKPLLSTASESPEQVHWIQ